MHRVTRVRTILIMGLRGSGKTTAASSLAHHIGWRCVDLDVRVREMFDESSVTDIFRIHGEPAFREGEAAALRCVLTEPEPTVVSLGGGTPTAPGMAGAIRAAAASGDVRVVYLRAQPEAIASRLEKLGVGDRPKLVDGDIHEEMRQTFDARDALYRELAGVEIDASQQPDDVRTQIAQWLHEQGIFRDSAASD